jgi:hypothetical protein
MFSEDSEQRRMRSYPTRETLFFVEVVNRKISGSIEVRKYRREGLVSAAASRDFRTALIETTASGLEEDQPAD